MEVIYTFNGKDITMNVLIQIRAVIKIIQKKLNLSFEDAMGYFIILKHMGYCRIRKMLFFFF